MLIIDVLERPQLAEEDKVLATPTLIMDSPSSSRRIIGDLTDAEKVITALNLTNGKVDNECAKQS